MKKILKKFKKVMVLVNDKVKGIETAEKRGYGKEFRRERSRPGETWLRGVRGAARWLGRVGKAKPGRNRFDMSRLATIMAEKSGRPCDPFLLSLGMLGYRLRCSLTASPGADTVDIGQERGLGWSGIRPSAAEKAEQDFGLPIELTKMAWSGRGWADKNRKGVWRGG